MATGSNDVNGIWQYGEDDSNTTFSALLNRLGSSTSTQIAADRTRLTTLELPGRVVQVVPGSTSSQVSNSTMTYVDTGLTATITPRYSTSKILVIVSQVGLYRSTGSAYNAVNVSLLRNSTALAYNTNIGNQYANTYIKGLSTSFNFLDSPGTTSAVTYKTQFANNVVASEVQVQSENASLSTIMLLEIKA